MSRDNNGKRVSLVLGSGGARGLAHIGVINYLLEQDYRIESIAGCSMGALVGGIYASGRLEEYEQWIRAIDRKDIVSLLDLSLEKGGFVKGDRIIAKLRDMVGDQSIEDLDVSYTAVATDLQRRREVWISRGPLFDAIRASISIPLLFTPVKSGDRLLVDGGVLNPVPIAPTLSDDTDLTIAVNPDAKPSDTLRKRRQDKRRRAEEDARLHERILSYLDELKSAVAERLSGDWGIYDVALQSLEAMQGTIARQKLASYPPDVLIEIPSNACQILEFDRADELIPLGYELAKRKLTESRVPTQAD